MSGCTWKPTGENTQKRMTHDERLGRMEVRIEAVEESTAEVRGDVKEIQKTIWKSTGALAVAMFIAPVLLKICKII